MSSTPPVPPAQIQYWSVLITAWTDALGPHLAGLAGITPRQPPSGPERSHSIAVVVMSAFAIESNAARLMVSKGWDQPKGARPDSPIPFLRDGLPGFSRRLLRSTEELFAVRNALAHNHIWEIHGEWTEERFIAEAVRALSGRPQAAILTADAQHTMVHRLDMVPEMVGYEDARKAVAILVKVLDALARLDVPHMRSAVDSTRITLPNGRKPTLREFRMPVRRPR